MTKAVGIVLALVAAAAAATAPNVERGRKLFHDSALGTNGRSCATCHEGGKRLVELDSYGDEALAAYANTCVEGMLKGKPLARDASDLRSLVLYLRTFQAPRR